jgi:uncharacterized protein involved in type VI secretion and phage assembly
MSDKKFLGKYRGIVTSVDDPLFLGRIKARVQDVYGDLESGWALPCFAFGGNQMGFFTLPDVNSGVWIEFEHGDPDYPIWVGSWYGSSTDMPQELKSPPKAKTMLMTKTGHKIILDDTPGAGGITIETATHQKISLGASGIEIDNGQGAAIKLNGPQVSINNGALEVT